MSAVAGLDLRLTSNPSRGPSAAYAAGLERLGTACRTFHLRGTAAFAFIMSMIGNHNTFPRAQ
jgi:hypothetical protein